ncbi:pre-toxin TG domain-containing protein [Paenibacillus massiliensis]|uniref:pre-toxin TG domain-containing protein n=1 Tax=Paenibacillus massiliensis TaxID=225917 RepID=UPI001CF7BA75|nr:pre-toxin TG domain-containing protein [Paenibacillus massiliensis]
MLRGGDMLLDLVPGVGALKGFQQAFTGVNLVTGEKLSVGQRWMEGIGSAIGLIPIPGSKAIGKYGVEGVVTLGKKAKGWFGKGTGKTEELITVYRGTNNYLENAIYDETGHLLSDATRIAYRESGNLANAYKASQPIHDEWLKIWYNSMDDYVQAHRAFGTDLPKAFRMDRTLMSVTTDEKIAKYFANGGMVYKAKIPKSQLIPQTLPGSTESEYLIKFGIGGFTPK